MLRRLISRYRKGSEEKKRFKEFQGQKADYDQFIEYLKYQTHLPALHRVKQNNIHKYRNDYGITIFVETGTFLGDMVEAQRNYFEKIYSIELGEALYHQAVRRFEKYSNVKILHGDSGVVLKDLLKEIKEPALFWLDGHYSSGITAKGDKNTPVMEELRTILNAAYNHVILIDDARLFTGKGDYPSIDEISAFVTLQDPERMVTVADDIIRILRKDS